MKIRIYVDGLNFYYGLAKPYNFKWVDLQSLFLAQIRAIIPSAEIEKIILFSAEVLPLKKNIGAKSRQSDYFKALKLHNGSQLELILGKFQETTKTGRNTTTGKIETVKTIEEKKTDVNLACRMVADAYTDAREERFDACCLISNDSDLEAPLKIKSDLKQKVFLITPRPVRGSTGKRISKVSDSLTKWVPKKNRITEISKEIFTRHSLPYEVEGIFCPKSEGWESTNHD